MKDITLRHFKNLLLFWFFWLLLFLIVMTIFIGTGDFILSIPWAFISLGILVIIGLRIKSYICYKHNTNILAGTITNVSSYKLYQITIKRENNYYTATYIFISSHIKNKVGKECTFVIDKHKKAFIKDIN